MTDQKVQLSGLLTEFVTSVQKSKLFNKILTTYVFVLLFVCFQWLEVDVLRLILDFKKQGSFVHPAHLQYYHTIVAFKHLFKA